MSKEAMKLVLEALERYQVKRQDFERFADVIAALEEALAKQEQCDCENPSQCWEPCGELGNSEEHAQVYQQEQGKPVAEVKRNSSGQIYIDWRDGESAIVNLVEAKLYTKPQQRKPLTDEQIETIRQQPQHHKGEFDYEFNELSFARAIEAAHGIKE